MKKNEQKLASNKNVVFWIFTKTKPNTTFFLFLTPLNITKSKSCWRLLANKDGFYLTIFLE